MVTEKQKAFLKCGIAQIGLPIELTRKLIAAGMIGPCGLFLWQRFASMPVYEYLGIEPEEYSIVCDRFNSNEIPYSKIKEMDNDVVEFAESVWIRGLMENIASGTSLGMYVHYGITTIEDYLEFRVANKEGYNDMKQRYTMEVLKTDLLLEQFGQSKERNAWRSIVCTTV